MKWILISLLLGCSAVHADHLEIVRYGLPTSVTGPGDLPDSTYQMPVGAEVLYVSCDRWPFLAALIDPDVVETEPRRFLGVMFNDVKPNVGGPYVFIGHVDLWRPHISRQMIYWHVFEDMTP